MTATRLQLSESDILEALERAIRPLDEATSMLNINDRLLDLMLDELLTDDDPARRYSIDPFVVLVDICEPAAYELAATIDDCDQAGHRWWGTYDQLLSHWAAKQAPNPAEKW